jgi:hypothetical protein
MPIFSLSQTSGFQNLNPTCSPMGLATKHAVDFGEELFEARVREHREPVVARRLGVRESRGRPDRAVLLEALVRRIGHDEVHRGIRQASQEGDGVRASEPSVELYGAGGGGFARCHGGAPSMGRRGRRASVGQKGVG